MVAWAKSGGACLSYMGISILLVLHNQHVLNDPDVFPFPVFLTFLQAFFAMVFALTGFLLFPAAYAWANYHRAHLLKWDTFKKFLLVAVLFSVSITAGNASYIFCNVAFPQMMKQSNPILSYTFWIVLGLEKFRWPVFACVFTVVLSCMLVAIKSPKFNVWGFALVMTSILANCWQMIIMQLTVNADPAADKETNKLAKKAKNLYGSIDENQSDDTRTPTENLDDEYSGDDTEYDAKVHILPKDASDEKVQNEDGDHEEIAVNSSSSAPVQVEAPKKVDPLSFVLMVSPFVCLLSVVVGCILASIPADHYHEHSKGIRHELHDSENYLYHVWELGLRNWQTLGLNCLMAFSLNISIATVILLTDALTLIICGLMKDILTILGGVVFFHDKVTVLQCAAFGVTIVAGNLFTYLRQTAKD